MSLGEVFPDLFSIILCISQIYCLCHCIALRFDCAYRFDFPPGSEFFEGACLIFPFVFSSQYLRFPGGSVLKNPPANAGDSGDASLIPGLARTPREGKATHSSILAWEISWIEEPGGLQSTGSQKCQT